MDIHPSQQAATEDGQIDTDCVWRQVFKDKEKDENDPSSLPPSRCFGAASRDASLI
jgi:hypothetical protein